MNNYYLGGYYLINGPESWWLNTKNEKIQTCVCINKNVLDTWCYNPKETKISIELKKKYQLNDNDVSNIHAWTLEKCSNGALEWFSEVFPSFEIAEEFRNLFFGHLPNLSIFSMYFPKIDSERIGRDMIHYNSKLILSVNSLKCIPESQNINEELMGFDFIEIEDDYTIHSMHCIDGKVEKIQNKFGIKLNANGLFDELNDWKPIRDYLNAEPPSSSSYCIAKIKRVIY